MKIKIFYRYSLFPSWPGYGLISTPVQRTKTPLVYLVDSAISLLK